MTIFIKVCGLTHADDVAAAVEAGADALGFVFAESTRRVAPEQAARLAEGIPAGVLRVAVMLHPTNDEWQAVMKTFRPDVLQTDAGDFDRLDLPAGQRRWPVYRQRGDGPVEIAADEYVYEGGRSGSGKTVDWQTAARVVSTSRMILAGGLGPDNVADAIEIVRPWGVDASSRLENAPGRKDAEKVSAYVAQARAALSGELPATSNLQDSA